MTSFLLIWNLLTFALYGRDKLKAKRHEWRTPEFLLILAAVAGGAVGALLGMLIFHHKTRKPLFFLTVPLLFLLQSGAFLWFTMYA